MKRTISLAAVLVTLAFGTLTAFAQPAGQEPAVTLQGKGQTATKSVVPPSGISVVTFTHSGKSNFIVTAVRSSDSSLLVNKIGRYEGQRLIVGTEPVMFDIDADGAWSLSMVPIGQGGSPPFSGQGDAISALFDPPSPGAWEISHKGKSNFIVTLHCRGGSRLIQNEIGPVAGSRVVSFATGPCLWEVEADGSWSLGPRQ